MGRKELSCYRTSRSFPLTYVRTYGVRTREEAKGASLAPEVNWGPGLLHALLHPCKYHGVWTTFTFTVHREGAQGGPKADE